MLTRLQLHNSFGMVPPGTPGTALVPLQVPSSVLNLALGYCESSDTSEYLDGLLSASWSLTRLTYLCVTQASCTMDVLRALPKLQMLTIENALVEHTERIPPLTPLTSLTALELYGYPVSSLPLPPLPPTLRHLCFHSFDSEIASFSCRCMLAALDVLHGLTEAQLVDFFEHHFDYNLHQVPDFPLAQQAALIVAGRSPATLCLGPYCRCTSPDAPADRLVASCLFAEL